MAKNGILWKNQDIQDTDLALLISKITAIDNDITNAENLLYLKRNEARNEFAVAEKMIKKANRMATGIHSNSENKLIEYGISKRKPKTKKGIPAKAVIINIKDDLDGEGFIITQAKVSNADYFEWQKAVAINGEEFLKPPFPFFKTNKKLTLTDNEVIKGKRCFYRVRAVNRAGEGEWSVPVSKVQ